MDDNTEGARGEQRGMADDWGFPVPEFFRSLGGRTTALNEAHIIARVALLDHIRAYKPWDALMGLIAAEIGLKEPADRAAAATVALLDAAQMDSLGGLIALLDAQDGETFSVELDLPDDVDPQAAQADIQAAVDALERALTDYLDALAKDAVGENAAERINAFVRNDLNLPWAWLAYDLLESFFVAMQGYATRTVYRKDFWVEKPDAPAPMVSLEYRSDAGRPVSLVINELGAQIAHITALVQAMSEHTPGVPTGKPRNPDVIRRYVAWLWRNRVLGESIRAIARNPGENEPPAQPVDIRRGIREASGLLGVAGQFWRDLPSDNEDIAAARSFWATEGGTQLPESIVDYPLRGKSRGT